MRILSKFKIAPKLYALIFLALAAIGAVATLGSYEAAKVYETTNFTNKYLIPSFNTLYKTWNAFRKVQISLRDHVVSDDDEDMRRFEAELNAERANIARWLDEYGQGMITDAEDKALLDADRAAFAAFLPTVDARLELSRKNLDDAFFEASKTARPLADAVEAALKRHVEHNEKLAARASSDGAAIRSEAGWDLSLYAFVALILLSAFGWVIANAGLARPIARVADNLRALAGGSLDVEIVGTSRADEIGDMARAAQVFKEFVQKIDAQNWIKTNEAKFAAAMQKVETVQDMAQTAMSMLCPLIGAQHGLFYVLADGRLEMRGRYGYRERKHLNTSFALGEGLVGQCGIERQPITITKPPADYIQINSGLGEATPAAIVLLPVVQGDSLGGVIELAGLRPFSQREIGLLDELVPVFATHLELLERNLAAQLLLKETQEQAARMEAQAAQLEEQSVEMEAQQAELAATEAWYRSIITKAPDGALVVDANGTIVLSNAKAEELFGYATGKMDGMSVDQLVPTSIRAEHYKRREGFMESGGTRRMGGGLELTGVRADGSEFAIEIGLSRLPDVGGRGPCAYASVRDVTERRAAEAALKAAKEAAEAATKAKGDFLASMSHEIRTPMNGITGMADLLAQTKLDDDQKHMLRTIRESGNALITVINDILDFSKIEAGKLDMEDISMSVTDALEGVASTLTPNATKKGIRIHTFVDPEIPEAVQGDAVRLRQILFNLTGNAVKFSDNKDVELRAVTERTDEDGRVWVRFDVIDHGIGISEDGQAKLFQAFSQAESSTTRKYGGTGLGLAICKRLVEMMDGTVTLKSKLGEGSTFTAEIPFYPSDSSRSREKPRDLHGLRILLLGAAGQRKEALVAYLDHSGADVVHATEERDAIERIRQARQVEQPFSSVFIDLGLDDARQRTAIAQIRAAFPDRKTPLILLQDFHTRGARVEEGDIVTVDANPMVRYRLVTAAAVAAGRASPQVRSDADEIVGVPKKAPSVDEALAARQLILLAEDNPTNQDVIRRQLGLLGYTCEVANNGAEGLKAWRSGRYVLLLTDCHMPEMDGYDLTRSIRNEEKPSGKRLPIIAVTANALQGEAERCIAAGMDDYVSKPIAMPVLRAALKKWMPEPAGGDQAGGIQLGSIQSGGNSEKIETAVVPSEEKTPPINDRAIKDMFGDDDVTFKEILSEFLPVSRAITADIQAAADAQSAKDIANAAHKLKSAARSVGADALADICAELEAAGKGGDLATIGSLAPRVGPLMDAVAQYIEAL